MLEILEKKDSAKKLKEEELSEKRKNRTKNKILKEKELSVKKQFSEVKKQMLH